MIKEGGPQAMDQYFHQLYRPQDGGSE